MVDIKNPPIDPKLDVALRRIVPTLEGWCSEDKACAMASLITQVKPAISVEIGVFGGSSLIVQAYACRHIGVGRVYGVDPWSAAASLADAIEQKNVDWWSKVDYEKVYRGCLSAILSYDLSAVCSVFRTTSARAANLFDGIDILHIDGNHSEVASTLDVALYFPKVKSGGYVWFDDIDWVEGGVPTTANAQRMLSEQCTKIDTIGNCALYQKK